MLAFGGVRDITSFESNPLAHGAIFDPVTRTWTATADAPRGAYLPAVHALADGRAVVMNLGGFEDVREPLIYDPDADAWHPGRALDVSVSAAPSIVSAAMEDGRILVVAGSVARIYDAVADTWTPAPPPPDPAGAAFMTRLDDGRILALGTFDAQSEYVPAARVFDPSTARWTAMAAPPRTWRSLYPLELPDHTVLVLGGPNLDDLSGGLRLDLESGQWSDASPPSVARRGATASRLSDGRILVLGGSAQMVSCAALTVGEAYDPSTDRWTAVGGLVRTRAYHVATILLDGTLLVALGGTNGRVLDRDCRLNLVLKDSEVLDPARLALLDRPAPLDPAANSGLAAPVVRALTNAVVDATAVPLPDGGALVVGGTALVDDSGLASLGPRRDVDRLDANGAVSPGAPLQVAHRFARVVALEDGSLLLVGSTESPEAAGATAVGAERFDPPTGQWRAVADPDRGRGTVLVALADGRALAIGGGKVSSDSPDAIDGSASVYDPVRDEWQDTQPIPVPRHRPAVVRLDDGRVLLMGGESPDGVLADTLVFDPARETWGSLAPLPSPRSRATAVLLRDGRVLLIGGYDDGGVRPDAVLYDPRNDTWVSAGALPSARDGFSAVVARDGRVLVAGGYAVDGSEAALRDTIVFDPVSVTWQRGPALSAARGGAAAVALGNGLVAIAGGATMTRGATTLGGVALIGSVELLGPFSP